MMNDVTDLILEEYLVESYTSHAAGSEAERTAAEKAFKFELTNGPEKMVHYSGKGSFPRKVGSFDLDNFHKAYDAWFEENSLLDLFTDEGKLINRGTYGRIKALDKTAKAVVALFKLWGAQFQDDMEFTSVKLVKEKAKDELKKVAEAEEAKIPDLIKTVTAQIKDSSEYKDLVKQYPAPLDTNIDVEVTAYCHFNDGSRYADGKSFISKQLTVNVLGVITDPTHSSTYTAADTAASISDSSEEVDDLMDWDTMTKSVVDSIKLKIQLLAKVARAAFFLNKNYIEFEKRPESKLVKVDKNVLNWFGYYDKLDDKFVRAKVVEFTSLVGKDVHKFNGLILVNVDDKKDRAGVFDRNYELVCARYNNHSYDSGSYKHYAESSHDDYFDSSKSEAKLKKFGITSTSTVVKSTAIAYKDYYEVVEAEAPFNTVFDKHGHYEYFIDSSD